MNGQPDIIIGGAPAQDVLPGKALIPPAGHPEDLPAAEPLDVPEIVREPPRAEEVLSPLPATSPAMLVDPDALDSIVTEAEQTVVEWIEDTAAAEKELQRRQEELGRARGRVSVLKQLQSMQRSGTPIVIGAAQV